MERNAPDSIIELAALLTQKYGKPTVVNDEEFKDECYTRHSRQHAYWKDANGTVIELDTMFWSFKSGRTCDNSGRVSIMSKQYLDSALNVVRDLMKAEENRKKKNLDNL